MSYSLRQARTLGSAALVATAITLGGGASVATAASSTVTAQCEFPQVGLQQVTLKVEVPDTVPVETYADAIVVSTTLPTAVRDLAPSLRAAHETKVGIHVADGPVSQTDSVPLWTAGPELVSPSRPTFFAFPGDVGVSVTSLHLNLSAFDAAGEPMVIAPLPNDFDGHPAPRLDNDPSTFDVFCEVDPGQPASTITVLPWDPSIDRERPSLPGPITIGKVTSTSATVSWGPSTDNFGVAKYVVVRDQNVPEGAEVFEVAAPSTSLTFSGLQPDSEHEFFVFAKDAAGNMSETTSATFRTLPTPVVTPASLAFGLGGSAQIKTLIKGSVPLKGSLALDINQAGGVTGNLALQEASARLVALGVLPLTAKIAFVASGRTTGTYAAGVLKTTSKMRIKVTQAKLFGAIPIVTGNTCQTRNLSDVSLTSGAGFSLQTGGALSGEFALSDLNGCGSLNGLISPLTSGTGNTITLEATPPAPPMPQAS